MSADLALLRQAYTQALLLAGRHWRRAADAVVQPHGISDATALPLLMIGRMQGEPRQNALADAVGIEGPSLVRLLDQLCAAGLVQRKEDPTDRRAKVLSLTPAGQSTVARMETDLDHLRESVFARVSRADLEASLRVFRVLQDVDRTTARGEAPIREAAQ
ncbi:MarR family winged helix-turn-helix transcriptional regulator [Methylobacterium brachythecii]|uniref:MarR family transcriptional regulator n=1 Tax=Methylobacterium brachythecii TaxID=1176177 RepID=A0A7W6AKS7_9HYPH|nr:MarR family transcriptional regulator [Methylobacterium brachythecii]MBB3905277.1 MarR family transcriptional regulator for hemolysin [Methylobacterium brachythecii]GLS45950.1 MarR family transcriptional regulator [Methylobacterium brachythecii]